MADSAGILLYRVGEGIDVLLVHPGGPFWAGKDAGAWSIPKGEFDPTAEEPWDAARREFEEELGFAAPAGSPMDLGRVTQKSGKVVWAFALAGDVDAAAARSNTFEIEWPPRSGRRQSFPEVDRAAWFPLGEAAHRINPAQADLLYRLLALV